MYENYTVHHVNHMSEISHVHSEIDMSKRKRTEDGKGAKRAGKRKTTTSSFTPTQKKKMNTKGGPFNVLRLSGSNRIMPDEYHTILEVNDTSNTALGSGGGVSAGVVYTANGIWDYTTSVGNISVPGFNVLAPMYRKYLVKGVRISFRAVNTSTNPVIMQLAMFNTGTTLFPAWSDLRQLASNKWCREKMLSVSGGQDNATLSMYVNLGDYIGDKFAYENEEGYSGATGASGTTAANPTNRLEVRCYALSADGTTNVAASALKIAVNLIYYVKYTGLEAQSG